MGRSFPTAPNQLERLHVCVPLAGAAHSFPLILPRFNSISNSHTISTFTGTNQSVTFNAPNGAVLATSINPGSEVASSIRPFVTNLVHGLAYGVAFDLNGAISAANPAYPGEIIRLPTVGAGATNPPIAAGMLPGPNAQVAPLLAIQIEIAGEPAPIVDDALSAAQIGVTDLYISVPEVAPGLEMLGISNLDAAISFGTIPIWVVKTPVPVQLPRLRLQ